MGMDEDYNRNASLWASAACPFCRRFLSGDANEQIDVLRCAWPICPEEDELDGFGFWFLTTSPASVVWLTSDGQEVWT
ncbi:DUF596 domain-containing protein [Pseudomonas brassicacearum]|uniref:DUF596 domain-containing protein n=1 Tax=Pseudomonas brassicacearum TaxID=930166 RepID=UPI00331F6A60